MSFRHLFLPQMIKFPDTPFNINISLNRYFGQPTLIVDGLIQSGDIMSAVWRTGIKNLIPKTLVPKSVLLLGLGGGSNTNLVRKLYPNAAITAVDIDPLMIDIGRKYFGLNKIKNIEIIIADALDFVKKFDNDTHYDLVLVDCFEGKYIPKKLENLDFLETLKKHSRFTLINRIFWYEHNNTTMNFLRSLATRFFFVTTRTASNIVISLV